jgi:hypothetical protein
MTCSHQEQRLPKDPSELQSDGAGFTAAAARMLDAAKAEPFPERIVQLAEQLEEALTKARAPVRSSDERR